MADQLPEGLKLEEMLSHTIVRGDETHKPVFVITPQVSQTEEINKSELSLDQLDAAKLKIKEQH